ncbi:unnamed protein product [Thlaspi arvense]|uniref:Uncharacterized protein n=1 Tax=Thlaspi arvense TaxID=13288 RepID=A0AAU9RD10_THLAR|nr:unnamed protein product [Thlaspi arvense]
MAKISVVVVLSLTLLVSINLMKILAEKQPTVGQKIDTGVTEATNAVKKQGGSDAAVTSKAKSVHGNDKTKYAYNSL